MALETDKTTATASAPSAADLLEVVGAVVRELQPRRKDLRVSLDSSLERDLGLDSLGRVELVQRLERTFGAKLPETALAQAETPRDLLKALAEGGSAGFAFRDELLEPLGAGEVAPDSTRTLLEVLDWHVQRHPDRRHILFYPGDGEPEPLTYGDLDRRARRVADGLLALGVQPRQPIGLMLPTSLDYFTAFYGVLLAGGIPVPLYPPARRSQIEDHLLRQAGILRTAEAPVLITFSEVLPLARLLRPQVPTLRRVITVEELSGLTSRDAGHFPEVREDDVAFLQFTSGSTGNPKGVVLTHANLLANLRVIGQGAELGPSDVAVSWLPLYHDMGLIGSWMGTLYNGIPLILMSPLTFLARPSRWLWAIHRHKGTVSPAPNFAYELCARRIEDAEIEGLDLSSWRYALNGAEPVSPAAIERFATRFARYGFDPHAMAPVYGLAECSLALAFPPVGRGPVVDAVDRDIFQRTGRAVQVEVEDEQALRFVSCGLPLSGHEVRIVDGSGREVGERLEGRLEFRGPSATSGYYRNPEATRKLLRGDDWVDSGDRAYIAAGEVYITGRVKDIIIRAGRNLYPQELEEAVGEIPGVRKGCVAVFGSPDPATGTERLVILAETRERDEAAREALRSAIQERAVDLLGSPAEEVVLAPPQTVPKTSSGKIRRAASRELYESGGIGRRGASAGWQLARLAGASARAQVGRWLRTAGDLLYAVRFYSLFLLAAPPLWLLVVAAPGRGLRRSLAKSVGRLLAFLTGTSLRAEGLENLSGSGPRILIPNHQSYLDAFVLTTLLPPDYAYVAKSELERNPIPRIFLNRLGTVFVERFEPAQGSEEMRKVLEAVRSGDSLVLFPEGTFHRAPGLLPFRMGAFLVAVDAGVPVVPVVIRGTRSKLRGDSFFPRRGGAGIEVLPPIRPEGEGWSAAVKLRDAVRTEILERCGEPDAG